jgi:hypothetical protein
LSVMTLILRHSRAGGNLANVGIRGVSVFAQVLGIDVSIFV